MALPGGGYDVLVKQGCLSCAGDVVVAAVHPTSAAVLTHPGLVERYAGPVVASLKACGVHTELITVPAGERYKNLRTVGRLYERFVAAGMDRRSVVVTVSGGVLGDVGGFAAATFLRGIPFVQVPTTLLAQVDASVGGKTGVDLAEGKNLVGAFHQPSAVLIDPVTLLSLPMREIRCGLAEVIKYGIISDEEFFALLGSGLPQLLARNLDALCRAVARSCRNKAAVVAEDEKERGRRAILNFGHTVGHALEVATGFREYRHGEAVAVGMVSACLAGEEVGVTPPEVTQSVVEMLRAAGLPVQMSGSVSADTLVDAMRRDKKSITGIPRFVLVARIGAATPGWVVPESAVRAALARQVSLL